MAHSDHEEPSCPEHAVDLTTPTDDDTLSLDEQPDRFERDAAADAPACVPGLPDHPGELMPSPGMCKEFEEAYTQIELLRGEAPASDTLSTTMREAAFRTFYNAAAMGCCAIVAEGRPDAEWAINNPQPSTPDMAVVAAAPGMGKSTLAKAFMVALVKASEDHRRDDGGRWPLGAVLLVHHVETAQRAYDELNALLPGRVAVFSREHDNARPPYAGGRTDRFDVDDLQTYPLLVVTHEFYKGIRGEAARSYTCDGLTFPRVLTFIDEKVNEVELYDVPLSEITKVHEFILKDSEAPPMVEVASRALHAFASPKFHGDYQLETPAQDPEGWKVPQELEWFTTDAAGRYMRSRGAKQGAPNVEAVFSFGASVAKGQAFVARANKVTRFVGYESALPQVPGMVLLDATADIDGVSELCPWRKHADHPTVRYDKLDVVHVPSIVQGTTKKWLAKNMPTYAQHLKDTILRHVAVGQKALVVLDKGAVALKETERVAGWSEHVSRFLETKGKKFSWDTDDADHFPAWDLEGRKIAVAWWGGYGIGANDWRDAEVVLTFEEYHLPRHALIATVQGLKGHKATGGALATLANTNKKKHQDVDAIGLGNVHRWLKQLALRGRAREFDNSGVCERQKLVVASQNLARLTANINTLFPGASFRSEALPEDRKARLVDQVISVLMNTTKDEITTAEVGEAIGKEWRKVSSDVTSHASWATALLAVGWCYDGRRGNRPGVFRRRAVAGGSQVPVEPG